MYESPIQARMIGRNLKSGMEQKESGDPNSH